MRKSFLFMLVFISSGSSACACISFNSILFQLYRRCCALGSRGVPESITQPYLKTIVSGLVSQMRKTYLPETRLNKICISPKDLHGFRLELELKACPSISQDAYGTHLFHLPNSLQYEKAAGMMNSETRGAVRRTWFRISNHLSSPVRKVDIEALSQLPPSLELLHDPNHNPAQDELWKYTTDEGDIIAAPLLVEQVLGIILKMEVLSMPRTVSVQILRHCAALVFLGCRVHRKEFHDLFIPSVFTSMYNEVLQSVVDVSQLSELPNMPEHFVWMHFKEEIRDLTSFKTWGRLRYPVLSPDCRVSVKDLEKGVLTKMSFIAGELNKYRRRTKASMFSEINVQTFLQNRNYRPFAAVHEFSGRKGAHEASTDVPLYFRKAGKCPKTHLFFKLQENASPRNCCAAICGSIELVHRLGMTSKKNCCLECNLARCSIRESSKLASLTTIHLPACGLSPAGSISITI
ncbi:hypothetical protein BWQ96_06014 [Gracilariopsis chorda]|uniref:Uncharacterized protein n=1 Tax=Gracilariopsis chorda TaxID=448386 RepID=A0A2V3IQ94_9FLOR|nr:hypothetical protein BWQ96_06014 [Gracilariopsis chorda]|eukprot:PXF44233.1 hypothetical protein BWQ96_06014 [Gracilariopsis chorda]